MSTNEFDELDNDYIPLEEFAPTLSRQEVIKRRKLADLIRGKAGWEILCNCGALVCLCLCTLRLAAASFNPFIYFQF